MLKAMLNKVIVTKPFREIGEFAIIKRDYFSYSPACLKNLVSLYLKCETNLSKNLFHYNDNIKENIYGRKFLR